MDLEMRRKYSISLHYNSFYSILFCSIQSYSLPFPTKSPIVNPSPPPPQSSFLSSILLHFLPLYFLRKSHYNTYAPSYHYHPSTIPPLSTYPSIHLSIYLSIQSRAYRTRRSYTRRKKE